MADSTETSQSLQCTDADETACVEAVLFASDAPLTAAKIVQVAGLSGQRSVTAAIETLNERYDSQGSAFRIEPIAGGYQMLTRPEYHDVLSNLLGVRSDSRLSRAALETLAIVAYRQPVLRADIEAIRGVASGEVLRGLMEKQLVKIVARADVIGRPMLYGTSRRFLEVFGLKNLDDLPRVEELRQGATLAGKAPPSSAPEEEPDSPPQQDQAADEGDMQE